MAFVCLSPLSSCCLCGRRCACVPPSNRVFTEGTCRLLKLVISDLVDEDFVVNRRQQAASALLFGMVALLTKPGQTFAPLIGTWLLCVYTGRFRSSAVVCPAGGAAAACLTAPYITCAAHWSESTIVVHSGLYFKSSTGSSLSCIYALKIKLNHLQSTRLPPPGRILPLQFEKVHLNVTFGI